MKCALRPCLLIHPLPTPRVVGCRSPGMGRSKRSTSSLSERKLDAWLMTGFLPNTGNHALISANFGAKVGPLSTERVLADRLLGLIQTLAEACDTVPHRQRSSQIGFFPRY